MPVLMSPVKRSYSVHGATEAHNLEQNSARISIIIIPLFILTVKIISLIILTTPLLLLLETFTWVGFKAEALDFLLEMIKVEPLTQRKFFTTMASHNLGNSRASMVL